LAAVILGAVLMSNGCESTRRPVNPGQGSAPGETISVGPHSPDDDLRHNYTSVSAAGWTAELWTSASAYTPWNGVDITLRLTAKMPQASPPAETVVEIDLLDAKTDEVVMHRRITPTFEERGGESPVAWQARLLDVVQSDMRKAGGAQLKVGYYLITVRVAMEREAELKIANIPIRVDIPRGH